MSLQWSLIVAGRICFNRDTEHGVSFFTSFMRFMWNFTHLFSNIHGNIYTFFYHITHNNTSEWQLLKSLKDTIIEERVFYHLVDGATYIHRNSWSADTEEYRYVTLHGLLRSNLKPLVTITSEFP